MGQPNDVPGVYWAFWFPACCCWQRVLLSINLNGMVSYVENQNEMVAFLEDSADDITVSAVKAALDKNSNVDSFSFVSREEALERYSEIVPDSLLENLEQDKEEVFPLSFRITLKDLSLIDETTAQIESIPGIMRVNAPTNVAETVTGIKRAVYICGSGIVIILLAVTLIIIANTIKVTVFNRRKEINIMKFVGATDLFIRMPFVVEGVLLGVISACLAYLILWGGYTYLMNYVQTQAATTLSAFLKNLVPFSQVAKQLLASFAVGGVAIGVFGSMIFVRKHLKV